MQKIYFFLLLAFPLLVNAQTWRASLYPEDWTPPTVAEDYYTGAFVQDFSYAGYHQGEREIPTITENIINVAEPPYEADPFGITDATSAIQRAIDKAERDGGGVVFLPSGTYAISVPAGQSSALHIAGSNVVLRGAGKDKTFIYNKTTEMRLKAIVRIEPNGGRNWDFLPSAGRFSTITSDLTGPTREIPLDNPGRFSVGDEVIVRALLTDAWCDEHNEPDWKPYPTLLDGPINYRIVTAVTDTGIIINIPTRYAFLTTDGARVFHSESRMLQEVGLEDFSIGNREIVAANPSDWLTSPGVLDNNSYRFEDRPGYETHSSSAIKMDRVRNGWIRNVSSYAHPDNQFGTHVLSNGIKMEYSANVTVDNCFMGYGQYGGGGGNAYGFRIESNDCLFINCSSEVMRHGFSIVRIWSMGNVLHRTHDSRTGKSTANGPGLVKAGSNGSDFHQWFSPSNLIDQMEVDDSYFSAIHREGIAASSTRPGHDAVTAHSVFWNFTANNSANGYAIRTTQTKMGYVFGTQGNSPGVNNKLTDPRNLNNPNISGRPIAFTYDRDGSRTNPVDLVEGVGQADRLEPQSLYLDQFSRRMLQVSTSNPAGRPAAVRIFPNPARGGVFNLSEARDWRAFDFSGRILATGSGTRVDLSAQSPGIYFLSTEYGSSKIVVQ